MTTLYHQSFHATSRKGDARIFEKAYSLSNSPKLKRIIALVYTHEVSETKPSSSDLMDGQLMSKMQKKIGKQF